MHQGEMWIMRLVKSQSEHVTAKVSFVVGGRGSSDAVRAAHRQAAIGVKVMIDLS